MNVNAVFERRISELEIDAESPVEQLLLREYGSVFAVKGATPPPCIVFPDERSVSAFQQSVPTGSGVISGLEFQLQKPAMIDLLTAVEDAERSGFSISPRGPDSGSRTYEDTVSLWRSRVEPAIDHWLSLGRISLETAEVLRASTPFDQVPVVLSLESAGIFFAKDLSKSIIYSVAPPGASQHLSMLAFDVAEFGQAEVRRILARRGWFRTVTSDLPHFTYLGASEDELPMRGLRKVENALQDFWVPDI